MAINTKMMKLWETTITFFSCACAYILGLPMATEVCRNFLMARINSRVINLCSIDLSSYLSKDIISETKYLLRVNIYIINHEYTHRYCFLI